MNPSDFIAKKTLKHTKGIEKEIGREYALLYPVTKAKLADLYAKMGDTPTLEEAQKYNKLNNLVIEVRKSYQRLTGKAITKTEMESKYNYVQEYYGSMWSGEIEHGKFKWKNPAVESIRASVMWEGTGLSFPKRFGKNFTKNNHRHRVVIGKDTRLSGYMIEPALTAGFVAMGLDVFLVGPVPTPAISMLTRSLRADIGIMISASHNPYFDNGIKIFDAKGEKLDDVIESEIEILKIFNHHKIIKFFSY
jgi:hypothetical protein